MATTRSDLQIVIKAKDEASSAFKGIGSSLTTFAKVGAAAMAAATGAALTFGLKSAASFEQTRISLTTMTGSVEEAGKVLRDVSQFAASTPFEFPELASTVKQLMAFGFSTNEAVGGMKMLGDISAGLNVPIGDLGYLLGTLRAQGRAFTIDIRQFAQRGLPIYEALSKTMGKSVEEVNDLISSGKVGFPEVQKALESMTAEGGKFHGMMAAQASSLSGLWSTLKDNIGMALKNIIGINEEGVVRDGSIFDLTRKGAENLIKWLNENQGSIVAFFQGLTNSISTIVGAWGAAKTAVQGFFQETNTIWVFIRDFFLPIWISVRDTLVQAWADITEALKPIMPELEMLAKFFGVIIVGAIMVLVKVIAEIIKIVAKVVAGIVQMFSGAIQIIEGLFQAMFSLFLGDGKGAIDGLKKAFSGFLTFLEGIAKTITAVFLKAFKPIEDAIKNLREKWNDLKSKVGGGDSDKRATGGSVMKNKPYLVGENGPEMFIPSGSGKIANDPSAFGGQGDMHFHFDFSNANIVDRDLFMRDIKQSISRDQELRQMGAV